MEGILPLHLIVKFYFSRHPSQGGTRHYYYKPQHERTGQWAMQRAALQDLPMFFLRWFPPMEMEKHHGGLARCGTGPREGNDYTWRKTANAQWRWRMPAALFREDSPGLSHRRLNKGDFPQWKCQWR